MLSEPLEVRVLITEMSTLDGEKIKTDGLKQHTSSNVITH